MTQFTVYTSADASAPTLSGTAGDLVNLLDKILVDGYGAKPGAGWTKAYTGTNQRQYRMGAGMGADYYVNDNTPSVAHEARVTMFETGTSLGAGTGQIPLGAAGLGTSYQVIRKSAAAGATTRSWVAFADSQTMYLCIITGDNAGVYSTYMFGSFYSFVPNDPYNAMLIARNLENTAAINLGDSVASLLTSSAFNSSLVGNWIARNYTGFGPPVAAGKQRMSPGQSLSVIGNTPTTPFAYPNGPDSAVFATPVRIIENSQSYWRGRLRGIYDVPHVASNFTDGDTLTFVVGDDYAAKTLRCVKSVVGSNLLTGVMWVETSNTVEVN